MQRDQLHLLALLAAWMLIAWPHIREQYSNAEQARAALAPLAWEDRTAALDQPGYRVAREIARATPPDACVVVLARTGPEHVKYYQARFAYYLYPRKARVADRADAADPGCAYLAVFRETPANLAQEPFKGHWDEAQLAARLAGLTRIYAADSRAD